MVAVETRKTAGVPAARPVYIFPMPLAIVDENSCNETVSGWMSPEEPDVGPAQIQVSAVEPVSRLLEEELGQCAEVAWEAPPRVAPVEYEPGHMMQWPDIKSDGVMLDGIMLESEMSPVGSVRGAAEPVLLAAKSEVLTPFVIVGGGGGRCCGSSPGRSRGSHSASFCPTSGWK